MSESETEGEALPAERRREFSRGESRRETDRPREEAIAAKNRAIDGSSKRREPQMTRKTDGVR
jgi:hypothetical protein